MMGAGPRRAWGLLRRPWRIVAITVAGFGLAFLAGASAIVFDGLNDAEGWSDVAVVLGTTVDPDGRPSARLAARLDRAADLWRAGAFVRVIVSGGIGHEGYNEAEVMRRYLTEHGVPAGDIILDSNGVDTYHTARFAAAWMREHHAHTVCAITQYFHIPRTRLALERFGAAEVRTAHAHIFEPRDLYSIPREVLGYCAYALRRYE